MVRIHVWDTNGKYLGYMRMTYKEAQTERASLLRMKYGEYGRTVYDEEERYGHEEFEEREEESEPIVYENEEDDPFNDLYYNPWEE